MSIKPKYVMSFLKRNVPEHVYYQKYDKIICANCGLHIFVNYALLKQREAMLIDKYGIVDENKPIQIALFISLKCKLTTKFVREFYNAVIPCKIAMIAEVLDS